MFVLVSYRVTAAPFNRDIDLHYCVSERIAIESQEHANEKGNAMYEDRRSLSERINTMASLLGVLEDVSRNDETLYLASAFVDLEDFRVAHQLLYWIITVVAVAAEDLCY